MPTASTGYLLVDDSSSNVVMERVRDVLMLNSLMRLWQPLQQQQQQLVNDEASAWPAGCYKWWLQSFHSRDNTSTGVCSDGRYAKRQHSVSKSNPVTCHIIITPVDLA